MIAADISRERIVAISLSHLGISPIFANSSKRNRTYLYSFIKMLNIFVKVPGHLIRWYDQLGGDSSPPAEAILDRIKYDAYKINIVPINPESYRSMREVYGLDPALSK